MISKSGSVVLIQSFCIHMDTTWSHSTALSGGPPCVYIFSTVFFVPDWLFRVIIGRLDSFICKEPWFVFVFFLNVFKFDKKVISDELFFN